MNKESGKKIVTERVEEFERNKDILMKKGHGETNIRSNYIDVLFKALGWNMKSHYEVVREYSQKDRSIDGATKKVDYAFKVNGKLKFFIEAKEASVDLEKDKGAIYQAKRYAYSSNSKAPIVILTDFEEFRVFNVIKAPKFDNPDIELLKKHSLKYTEYIIKWDLIWDTFSKEAVENGSLDKLRGKIDKNTKTMDVDFLEQITGWRETLAKNIALRNKDLTVDEINEAVQRILDRLFFVRNLEDREIEPENTLFNKTNVSKNIYKAIVPIFNSLDKTYNGLFFKKHFSENLEVEDKAIKAIIRQMCYPISPFQFDVIEPEILGRIYEKFLGSKIRLTDSHRAKIEEKIEVRKAGGIYYTPEYIVEYIVKNTVGKKIEGLAPEEIKKIKIVDPACGSGSFLIGAYAYLLDYHQKWYSSNKKDKTYKADWYKSKDGELKVRLDKRGDILKNNIFGVDIDKEANEVAIMSLYLKMLDDGFDKGERDLFFVKGSVLPDMVENVKCGNSLIRTDYFDEKLDFVSNEFKQMKPFDWIKEFSQVFNNRGFDCVIGNPPYGASFSEPEMNYFKLKYETSVWRGESYLIFVEKAISLLNENGLLGFIIPDTLLNLGFTSSLRKYVLQNTYLNKIVLLPSNIFIGATVDTIIVIAEKGVKTDTFIKSDVNVLVFNKKSIITQIDQPNREFKINTEIWYNQDSFNLQANPIETNLLFKIENGKRKIKDFAEMFSGIKAYEVGKGNPPQTKNIRNTKPFTSNMQNTPEWEPFYNGKHIGRYQLLWGNNNWIHYGKWLAAPRNSENFEGDKILIRKITGKTLLATYIPYTSYCNTLLFVLKITDSSLTYPTLIGILNSTLIGWYFRKRFQISDDDTFPQIMIRDILEFPIPEVDKINSSNISTCVSQIIKLNEKLNELKSDSDKLSCENNIKFLDEKIDNLVYQIYELTSEEIEIIERL